MASEQNKPRQLFGTDGIRGVAGEYPLNRATVYAIGRALGTRLKRRMENPSVVLGQDTRESSAWIAEAVALGLRDAGCGYASAGVVTTPGLAYLTRTHGFAAGVVVSASHNPWQDNGIKLFGANGMKLADEIEHEIEQEIFSHLDQIAAAEPPAGNIADILPGAAHLRADYEQWLAASIDAAAVKPLRILMDCANGAASVLAPELFTRLGVKFEALHTAPTGRNINDGCGALHPEHVAQEIAKRPGEFDLGVTFDGDADRALFSDAQGNVVNGDSVLLVAARQMKSRGSLRNDTVVATTMSNMGLEKALRSSGIAMLRSDVGDKYVLEQMLKTGATLGGEQSGHILFMDGDSTTGDGLLTALRVMEVIATSGKSLLELTADFKVFPQRMKNVKVREKVPMKELPTVMEAIAAAERELDGNGRVIVRYSGTERLARVMIEADDEALMHKHVDAVAAALEQAIGA